MICQFFVIFFTLNFNDPKFVLPGTVKICNYYIENSEVTNSDYLITTTNYFDNVSEIDLTKRNSHGRQQLLSYRYQK